MTDAFETANMILEDMRQGNAIIIAMFLDIRLPQISFWLHEYYLYPI